MGYELTGNLVYYIRRNKVLGGRVLGEKTTVGILIMDFFAQLKNKKGWISPLNTNIFLAFYSNEFMEIYQFLLVI
jgi:hypothetical protein